MPYFTYKNKKVFFEEIGNGNPLIFLHGNTASSKMFSNSIDLYEDKHKVILIDFLGHGKSDRLDKFPADLWFDEAMQVIQFIEYKKYDKVNIIGSSGGALAALNVALERPDLVDRVIADSFEGETPLISFAGDVEQGREDSKKDEETKHFYIFNQGDDWESVIDNDTRAIAEHAKKIGRFFHKPLDNLQIKVLMTGSKEDEFVEYDFFEKTYSILLKKIKNGQMYLFENGRHPAATSNPVEFAKVAEEFFSN